MLLQRGEGELLIAAHQGLLSFGHAEIRSRLVGGIPEGTRLFAPMPEPKAWNSAMRSSKPEDWPAQFTQHLDSGDLEAILALYEPEARFVPRSGETIVGRERIRDVLAGLIRSGTKLRSRVIQAITAGDIAILYTDFEGTTTDPSGTTVEVRSKAIEVLHRQPDGTWKLIIGDPNGRE